MIEVVGVGGIAPLHHPRRVSNPSLPTAYEDAMTYAIHGSKDGQSVVTIRISPVAAVVKARLLEGLGWQVHITDSAGHQFGPLGFDQLLLVGRETA
jgi:hypothetical protein